MTIKAGAAFAAYQKANDTVKSTRENEKDVFSLVTQRLRDAEARPGDSMAVARAVGDNMMLWSVLISDLTSEENKLPVELRGSIISVGMAVMRECEKKKQAEINLRFLIDVNENIIGGLV